MHNNFVESYKYLNETRNNRSKIAEQSINEALEKKKQFKDNYYNIREAREIRNRRRGTLMESCRNDALSTAIKAIYITALEAGTLTDNGLILAESMVDNWIKEKGGASKILTECQNNTYLLARISQIVEQAAIMEADELEELEDEDVTKEDVPESKEETNTNTTSTNSDIELAAKVIEDKLGSDDEEIKSALDIIRKKSSSVESNSDTTDVEFKDDEESDESEEKEEKEEEKDSEDSEGKDDSSESTEVEEKEEKAEEDESDKTEDKEESDDEDDPLNASFDDDDDVEDEEEESDDDEDVPDDATTDEDDNETDVADDITDDEDVPENLNVDGDENTSSNGKIFDELEKEEDVQKAVELIRDRVADAEEALIKKNAEDKKAMDELIGRISDNVKTVEDIADKDNTNSKIAEESARMCKQKIDNITNNRPLTVLEKMTRNLHQSIVRDTVVRENYIAEDGSMDTALIIESAKVMYGFLETINTLQLEKVDSKYIENVINNMN